MLLLSVIILFIVSSARAGGVPLLIAGNSVAIHKGDISNTGTADLVTLAITDVDDDHYMDFSELYDKVVEKMYLKPSNLKDEEYIFLWFQHQATVFDSKRNVPLTTIKTSEASLGTNSLEIPWNQAVQFVQDVKDFSNYMVDLGDGDALLRGKLTKSCASLWSLEICAALDQPAVSSILERLAKLNSKEISIGGPYVQVVEPKFLHWSVFGIVETKKDGDLTITLTGNVKNRENCWIKLNGNLDTMYPGKLVTKENGGGEFHIEEENPELIEANVKECTFSSQPNKLISALSIASGTTGNHVIPDRKIFDVTSVSSYGKKLVIKFNWLENKDGHSFTHIVKAEFEGPVYLLGALYFDKKTTNGTIIVYPSEQQKSNEVICKEVMNKIMKYSIKNPYNLEVSGPRRDTNIKFREVSSTPLKLITNPNPTLRDNYYLEFTFSGYE